MNPSPTPSPPWYAMPGANFPVWRALKEPPHTAIRDLIPGWTVLYYPHVQGPIGPNDRGYCETLIVTKRPAALAIHCPATGANAKVEIEGWPPATTPEIEIMVKAFSIGHEAGELMAMEKLRLRTKEFLRPAVHFLRDLVTEPRRDPFRNESRDPFTGELIK